MKRLLFFMVAAMALTGCATMVRIDSNVQGAKVTIDDRPIGLTPATTSLSDFDFASYAVKLEKEGYKTTTGVLKKEIKMGTVVGSLFLWPFVLWIYGPTDAQYFEMVPADK